ncbi:helix-turn-helix domain-containing protein [Streptomyces hygroscopicus]
MVASDVPIGDRIRHYRGERRQDVVAGLVGISPDYLSQIERGLKIPSLSYPGRRHPPWTSRRYPSADGGTSSGQRPLSANAP